MSHNTTYAPSVVVVESDFESPDETLREYHYRLHPLPAPRDVAGFLLIGAGCALAFLLAVTVAYGALVMLP